MLRDILKEGKKMIKLNIEEYCKNCPEFEVVQETLKSFDMLNGVYAEHHLTCGNIEKCREIKKHLEKVR